MPLWRIFVLPSKSGSATDILASVLSASWKAAKRRFDVKFRHGRFLQDVCVLPPRSLTRVKVAPTELAHLDLLKGSDAPHFHIGCFFYNSFLSNFTSYIIAFWIFCCTNIFVGQFPLSSTQHCHMGLFIGKQATELRAWLSGCELNNRCAVTANGFWKKWHDQLLVMICIFHLHCDLWTRKLTAKFVFYSFMHCCNWNLSHVVVGLVLFNHIMVTESCVCWNHTMRGLTVIPTLTKTRWI